MTSEVVSKDFLMAVINEARLHGMTSLTIRSVLLDLDLLGIDLIDNRMYMMAGRKEFYDALAPIRSKGMSHAIEDLPNYEDMRAAIWRTTLLPDEIGDLVCEGFKDALRRRCDPYRYPRQMAIAIDTNIAYHRLMSRMLLCEGVSDERSPRLREIQIIVSSLVEEEISRAIARKYSTRDITELQRAVRDQVLVRNMGNICYKRGRMALNAQTEIHILGRTCNLWRVGGRRLPEDREHVDDEIVRSLAEHSADQRMDLFFITGDDKCRAHAFAHKLPSIFVEYPNELPEEMAFEPCLLIEMLYDLSVIFVGLQLVELDLKIIGDWSGKSAGDYHDEKVKLIIAEESSVGDRLRQDLRIVRALQPAPAENAIDT